MEGKKRIIYIIGAGRSGTTLLDIILSNHAAIFTVGELNRYPLHQGVPPQTPEPSEKSSFWKKILEKNGFSPEEIERQRILHDRFEYHAGFFKSLIRPHSGKDYQDYLNFIDKTYSLIFQETGTSIILDSSKYPGRASNLRKLKNYEVSYVYLKRDPVQVVRSFAKKGIEQPPKHWLLANLYYFAVNLFCRIFLYRCSGKHKVASITYEEMMLDTGSALDKIGNKLGIDFAGVKSKVVAKEPLKVGWLFEGNRIRTKPTLSISYQPKKNEPTLVDRFTRIFNYLFYNTHK